MSRSTTVVRNVHSALGVVIGIVAIGATLGACIGVSPEEALRDEQGEAHDGDEEHRPGQPCLVCHAEDYHPGGPAFALAGTIYAMATDPDDRGLEGAEVSFIDADGRAFSAVTNSAGNFMIGVEPGLAEPRQRGRGRAEIPWQPAFPVTVAVIYDGEDKSMESQIWREGSCAGCHRGAEPGTDHVEKVWHAEAPL